MKTAALAASLAPLVLAACVDGTAPQAPPDPGGGGPIRFGEVARASGIEFGHVSGADGRFRLPEIMGAGAGWLDYDGDGWLDAYLVQSGRWTGPEDGVSNRLYRNRGDGRFVDVTVEAAVGDTGYGMGCAAGDYDNDGDVDLYVTNLGPNVLYRNEGDGRFVDVTDPAGVGDPGWSTSATFVDFDADGDLDLMVANYVAWKEEPAFVDRTCLAVTGSRDYCSPQAYGAPSFDTLYRNEGDGRFTDVSEPAGLRAKAGTGLGVVATDLDGDHAVDLYVSNDQMPSFAWIQRAPGRFEERAVPLGVAVSETGKSQAGMGVVAADVDADGDLDLWKVHLYRESHVLYRNEGGYFDDVTSRFALAAPTRAHTGFGTGAHDFDLDGRLDLFVANGRVQYVPLATGADDPYAEPNQILRGIAGQQFQDVSSAAGPALALVENSRAAAFADYDNDGDVDVLVANRDGPARLYRNDSDRLGGSVTLRIVDDHGRDALGARVTGTIGGAETVREASAGYSYCASNDPRVQLGLGRAARLEQLIVRWPTGEESIHGPFDADVFVELRKPAASAAARPADATASFTPQREKFREIARRLKQGDNPYFGQAQLATLQIHIADPALGPFERVRARAELAVELTRLARFEEAAAAIDGALATASAERASSGLLRALHRVRGMVYLRRAEVANCIERHHPDSCVFPLRGGGVHVLRGPALEAWNSYRAYLEIDPQDLKIRWLLNLVAMALGEYPEGVPGPLRIPPEAWRSEQNVGRFVDVASRLGVDTFNLCGGAVVDDFDGDGRLDIVTSTSDPEGPLTFYRNQGNGRFQDRSTTSRIDDQLGGLNVQGADYDGDGDVDLLILRGAWLYDDGRIRNSLLRNDGDGTFRDVTAAAGVVRPEAPTQAAAWADFDNDGNLDLYVCNESRLETRGDGDYPSQLFLNDGRGRFHDVGREAGVTNDRYCKGVAAGDYDNDGDMDLYVSNVGPNRLYRNDGQARFTDVAAELGVDQPAGRSFATWFFDYDNDGWLDLFVAAYDARVEDVAADYLGLPDRATRPRLYRNQGGSFADVAQQVGLDHAYLPMGANFGDLDNDGWLDVYLATGDPDFQTLVPNVMLRNDGGLRFVDVSTSGGFGHLQKGHGVAFADLDNDGDQDIYHQLGGFYPGDAFANALFVNPGHAHRFLVVELEGRRSNRSGVGARIRVTVDSSGGRRTIHRAAGSVSSFGGSPRRQEIGLGDAIRIVELEVEWPATSTRQRFDRVPLDQAVLVREAEPELRPVPFPRVRLPFDID